MADAYVASRVVGLVPGQLATLQPSNPNTKLVHEAPQHKLALTRTTDIADRHDDGMFAFDLTHR